MYSTLKSLEEKVLYKCNKENKKNVFEWKIATAAFKDREGEGN